MDKKRLKEYAAVSLDIKQRTRKIVYSLQARISMNNAALAIDELIEAYEELMQLLDNEKLTSAMQRVKIEAFLLTPSKNKEK